MKELAEIQKKLVAPKNQRNNFGKYNYRSCEDILEAVKPLLGDSTLTISDEMVEVGGRVYVKSTAAFMSPNQQVVECYGWAREPEDRKGMDASQITGASSSYARKYALNGLFCIDDSKDADATNDHKTPAKKAAKKVAKMEEVKMISAQQITNIATMRKSLGIDDATFTQQVQHFGSDTVGNLTQEGAGKLIAAYTKKLQG